MKAFKKLALVTAIAAAPFAQAELTSIDDAALSNMTGQAGITIELDTAISIANITYTDTDGTAGSAGSLGINGVAFGGGTVGGSTSSVHDARLDDFKIDIDVDGTNGVVIHLGGTDSASSLVGANPVDFGLHVDSVTASGVTNNIASNINIAGNLGPIDVTINNTTGADLIDVKAFFEVTSGSLEVDVIGLGISNLKIGQDSNPIYDVTSAYRTEIATALQTNGLIADASTATDAELKTAVDGAAPVFFDVAVGGDGSGSATTAQVLGAVVGQLTLDNGGDAVAAQATFDAIVVAPDGTTMGDLADDDARAAAYVTGYGVATKAQTASNMAFIALTIGNGSANYTSLSEGDVVVDSALIVNLTDFNIDVSMDLTMGKTAGVGRSLGSLAINDLNMSGTVLKIYGH